MSKLSKAGYRQKHQMLHALKEIAEYQEPQPIVTDNFETYDELLEHMYAEDIATGILELHFKEEDYDLYDGYYDDYYPDDEDYENQSLKIEEQIQWHEEQIKSLKLELLHINAS